MVEGYKNGKRVVKFTELVWEQNKQAIIKRYSDPLRQQDVAAPFWLAFIHHIKKHSGKHTHQGGLPIYVLEGKGYSVVDGVRYNWKKGDLLLLPIKPGGVEHQHFNENPDEPARWIVSGGIRFWISWPILPNRWRCTLTGPVKSRRVSL